MRVRVATGVLIAVWVLAGSTALGAEPTEISGRVLDAAGDPVEGIVVATYWISKEGRWTTSAGKRTDAEGRFSFPMRFSSRARSLMALDASQEHGAVVKVDAEAAKEPLVLRLRPTTLVKGVFTNEGLGYPIEKLYVSFMARPARIAVASHRGAPSYALRLPPGDYDMMVGGVDCERMRQRVSVTKDMRVVDMGTTDLQATIIAQHYGKAPPAWHVTDARGVDPETTLADFKGKWVLLEFWGYW